MCGRLSLSAPNHRAAAKLLADAVPGFEVEGLARWLEQAGYRPRYNVGPGQEHWLIRGREDRPILDRGVWGFAMGAKPGKLVINARAETVATKPMFRAAFARTRCLIPADGFFEWQRREHERQPWWFHRPERSALLFAALVDPPASPDAAARFSIVTVPASEDLRWIHDRMPAIVDPEAVRTWLFADPRRAHELLGDREHELEATQVSTRYNSLGYDEPLPLTRAR
ncbi:putative SOS response-associated peptidase YedK [Enhygromyxa salina]|uniref:Abasic site processing protein n=1 Tax=Enhygromyxa salina TaxID=215803 RepID=A0A2S9XH68_9BACT|nr:SOS response-associated peptidase [Enhygromyxa salina]PRP92218.1 putative SOS response-associated peptidase YedK [Enhygromyxa salina]